MSSKTKIIIAGGALIAVLFLGAVGWFIFKAKAASVKVAQEQEAVVENPVEYHLVTKPTAQSDDDMKKLMVGTWRMAGSKSWGADAFTYNAADSRDFKSFTLTNWALVTYDSESNVVYSAGGRYTVQNGIYTEFIDTATGPMTKFIGKKPKFKARVDGDKFYQMSDAKKVNIEEMWQRVGD